MEKNNYAMSTEIGPGQRVQAGHLRLGAAGFAPEEAAYHPVTFDKHAFSPAQDENGWFSCASYIRFALSGTATVATVSVKVEYRAPGISARDLVAPVSVTVGGVTDIVSPVAPMNIEGIYEMRILASSATGTVALGGVLK